MRQLCSSKPSWGPRRNVVVTGIGLITPLGLTSASSFASLTKGLTGILSPYTLNDTSNKTNHEEWNEADISHKAGGLDFPIAVVPDEFADSSGQLKRMFRSTPRETRCTRLAMHATRHALLDAGLIEEEMHPSGTPLDTGNANVSATKMFQSKSTLSSISATRSSNLIDTTRVGVNVGVGIPSIQDIARCGEYLRTQKEGKLSPYFVPKILGNAVSGQISLTYGFRGGSQSIVSACSTGSHCIGEAFRVIERGECDVMITGAAESCIHPIALLGFHRMRALSRSRCTPFDEKRNGFVMGEGAAVLILEEAEFAFRRRQLSQKTSLNPLSPEVGIFPNFWSRDASHPWYAELVGYGVSSDAYHVTAPDPQGTGGVISMKRALNDAGASMTDISFVSAHAAGTRLGDPAEIRAIEQLQCESKSFRFDESSFIPVPVVSMKGALGHLLGAAGSVETALAILCMQQNECPGNTGLEVPLTHNRECVSLPRGGTSSHLPKDRTAYFLKNSFGFGGTNATLIFRM